MTYPRRNSPEVNKRDWTIFQVGSLTGMRLNEILSITLPNINWEKRIITIPAENAKNKRESFVWINNKLKEILKSYLNKFKPHYWLFYSISNYNCGKDKRLEDSGFHFNWRRYLDHAELGTIKFIDKHGHKRRKILFHTATRTYFINQLFRANPKINIVDLSRISRHRSVQCLYDYYLRFNDVKIWENCANF